MSVDVPRTPSLDFAAGVALELVLAVRRYWSGRLYRQVADQAQRAHRPGDSVVDLECALADSLAYQAFGWIEHHVQLAKYRAPDGLLAAGERHRDELAAALDAAAARHPERLNLDADLTLPDYYARTDFHLVPGGIHTRVYDGLVYEWAAGSATLMANENRDVHDSLADHIAARIPADGAVLDIGCGFGRTVVALGRALPRAYVVGVDLSAPALRLAHLRAVQHDVVARFVQGDAEHLSGLGTGTFDAVTATMLIHELPRPALRALLRAARRVLRPGGRLVLLDFYLVPGGTVGLFFHLGHARRNGEPFMPVLLDTDLPAELAAAGFVHTDIEPYPPGQDGAGLPAHWRLPWTLIEARAGTVEGASAGHVEGQHHAA